MQAQGRAVVNLPEGYRSADGVFGRRFEGRMFGRRSSRQRACHSRLGHLSECGEAASGEGVRPTANEPCTPVLRQYT
jgi:hypothetical protein